MNFAARTLNRVGQFWIFATASSGRLKGFYLAELENLVK